MSCFFHSRYRTLEQGGSVVSLVVTLPLLLVFLFAVLDIGRTIFLNMALQEAAYAACRVVADEQDPTVSEKALIYAAKQASPGLNDAGLVLNLELKRGNREVVPFVQHRYQSPTQSFEEYPAQASWVNVEVVLTLEGRYLTPLGILLAGQRGDSKAGFVFEARAQAVVDKTLEGGLW